MKKYSLIIFLSVFFVGCQLSPSYDLWREPIELSASVIELEDDNKYSLQVKYMGEYNIVDYNCYATKEWLIVENSEGELKRGEATKINISVNQDLLEEGLNVDTIYLFAGSKHERHIPVKINGEAQLEISPSEIDFGLSSSIESLSLKSLSGDRLYNISVSEEWLSIDKPHIFIAQGDVANINVMCNRAMMSERKYYHGYITIDSQEGTYSCVLDVYAVIPPFNSEYQVYDEYLISISKVYRDKDYDVVCVELQIENTSNLFRTLSFNAVAIDMDGNSHNSYSNQINIKKNSIANYTIKFNGVPETVSGFQCVILNFNATDMLKFNDINF